MKITTLETLRPAIQPNLLFVRLHTDVGLIGLGEAFHGPRAVETYLHETVADVLLGVVDPSPEAVGVLLAPYVGYQGAGAETRGNGAVDVAVWDLIGQRAGLPLTALFGGPVRDRIKMYNTCAGPGYVSRSARQESANWGLTAEPTTRYEDLQAFLTRPGELSRELWDEGVRGMKIWPFDTAAEASGGVDISASQLAEGVAIVEAIRAEVGFDMDLMIELHGLWNARGATRIADALAPYRPFWVEDPVRPDAVAALAHLARNADVPIAAGETCVGRRGFLPLLQQDALDVVTVDVQWTGGLTEARKVAALADAFGVPVAPHDCTGPASLAACVHLVTSQPNGLVQETVRAFLRTWYEELVTGLPIIEEGFIRPTEAPGHGVRLQDDLVEGSQVERTVSSV